MKILVNCKTCPEVAINVEMQGSYFGPEISCAKCGSTLLAGTVNNVFITPQFSGAGYTGTAVMPPMQNQTIMSDTTHTFFWPPKFTVVDAEHAETCRCTSCTTKA
jgi:hypothetical protein